jgi:two-component system LytT family response regulator
MIENISCNNSLNSKIVFPIENGFKVVKINSIMFCQSDINYTKITLDDGTSFILSKTLKIIEELLPSSIFVRVHKSYLVNFNFVFYFNRNLESYVELSNQIKIPVSIRKKDEVILKLSSI